MANRGIKICLVVSSLFLIIVAIVTVALFLTIFKPKNPGIFLHPVNLDDFELLSSSSAAISPLNVMITIVNPNYGNFKYKNSTGYINYNGSIIAEVPIVTSSVPARSIANVSASAGFMTQKLSADNNFLEDIEDGAFNLTANATLPGKVSMLKIFKLKAKVYISCDIVFNITSVEVDSTCISKIKL
ncbi:hypothetical protein RJT34_31128 [Clitoria ternatea]|uniref:Late embryogenesis abundant protein LEA-2 subgroup domain-containing protein n=1 Tax=Clitoria ternatea TaxID=43366 RepID=A0AAN9EVW7_CLITE